jgi:hypothetical protein
VRRRWPLAVVLLVFVGSRVFLLTAFSPLFSDLSLYAYYAIQHRAAARHDQTLYEYRASEYQRSLEEARQGLHPPPIVGSDVIEYPPLALSAVLLPAAFLDPPRDDSYFPAYASVFRLLMALVDGLGFGLVWWLAARLYPDEGPVPQALRLGLYTVAGFLLGHVLYDRLDQLLAVAIVATLALLLTRARPVWFLAGLAVAIHLKLIPLLLVPLLLLASVRPSPPSVGPGWPRARDGLRQLARNGGGLLALVALLLLPFYGLWGARCLDFLRYHGTRGIQVESLYASIVLLLGSFGLPTRIVVEYGAADVLSPLSGTFARLSPILVLLSVGALAVAFARRLVRSFGGAPGETSAPGPSRRSSGRGPARAPMLATTEPHAVLTYALVTLLAALVTSKVLSTQYLTWLIPLIALTPLRPGARAALFVAFLGLCTLTAAIFPYYYFHDVVGMIPDPASGAFTTNYAGATRLGKLLLFGRNGLLLTLAIVLGASLLGASLRGPALRPRGEAPSSK